MARPDWLRDWPSKLLALILAVATWWAVRRMLPPHW